MLVFWTCFLAVDWLVVLSTDQKARRITPSPIGEKRVIRRTPVEVYSSRSRRDQQTRTPLLAFGLLFPTLEETDLR